jgi:dUTP pyrophosphatase
MIKTQIKKLHPNAKIPFYATEQSAGMDLSACFEEEKIIIPAGETRIIPTGIAIALPKGFEAQIRPRSGLAAKNSVTVLNTPGTIDSDYRGEIKVIMINHAKTDFEVEQGMRIAQMIIAKHEVAEFEEIDGNFDSTERGISGFGSTGVK